MAFFSTVEGMLNHAFRNDYFDKMNAFSALTPEERRVEIEARREALLLRWKDPNEPGDFCLTEVIFKYLGGAISQFREAFYTSYDIVIDSRGVDDDAIRKCFEEQLDLISGVHLDVPVITRYLVSAGSYLNQPHNYYNIYAACRGVNMVQFLDVALQKLRRSQVTGLDTRLERLKVEKLRDAFDAIAYEIITAAAYTEHSAVTRIEFIEENRDEKTPDFVAWFEGDYRVAVECKKIDRTKSFMMEHRDNARNKLSPVLQHFRRSNTSVSLDVTFHVAPAEVDSAAIIEASEAALAGGCAIIEREITVSAIPLPTFVGDGPTLYPSPKFLWERYGYKIRSKWIGIVPAMECSRFSDGRMPKKLRGGDSTWINDVRWDAAAKWRISSEEIMSRYRRFGFGSIFDALKQVEGVGDNSVIHVWIETEYFTGNREDVLRNLGARMEEAAKDIFGWIVFNEMLIDVSPKGRFDIIENSHMIGGPLSRGYSPPVSTVFVPKDAVEGLGEFGRGLELPEIDDVGHD